MTNLSSLTYWLTFAYFFLAVFIAFYIPGSVTLRRFKLSKFNYLIFSLVLGIVLWGYQGFILGFLHLRQLSYFYLLVFALIYLKQNLPFKFSRPKFELEKKDIVLSVILISGVGVQLLFTFLNGVEISSGIYFCCGIPDSFYHIALTDSLTRSFPPLEPAMYGTVVNNYHYLSNLIQADFIRVFQLPLIATQYQFMPLLISALIGCTAISFSKMLKMGKSFTAFLLLFVYFFGDLTFVLAFLEKQGLNFNVPFLYDSTALWYSPPRAFAILTFLAGLSFFVQWTRKRILALGIITALIFGSLVGLKIYNGLIVLMGLFSVSLYFAYKRQYLMLVPVFITGLISSLVYLPVNGHAGGLAFTGFWRVENFISQPGLGTSQFELAREIYMQHHNLPRLAEYEIIYTLFYFLFVFGVLNIGWIKSRKMLSNFPKELNIFLIPSLLISLFLGFFFFQKTGGANTSQFLITAEVVGAIYASLTASYLLNKITGKLSKFLFVLLILLITVPRVANKTISQVRSIQKNEGFTIAYEELQALDYLKSKTPKNSLVLSDNTRASNDKLCYYLYFYSQRNLYICNARGILTDHGVDVEERVGNYNNILRNINDSRSVGLTKSEKIDYIYTSADQGASTSLKTVFLNKKFRIIKTDR